MNFTKDSIRFSPKTWRILISMALFAVCFNAAASSNEYISYKFVAHPYFFPGFGYNCLSFEFDQSNLGHYFLNQTGETAYTLVESVLSGEEFSEIKILCTMPGGCEGLVVKEGADGGFRFAWLDRSGRLWFTTYYDEIAADPIMIDTGGFGTSFPRLDIGPDGQAHIGFYDGAGNVIYIRQKADVFQTPLKVQIGEGGGDRPMDIGVSPGNRVYVACWAPDDQLMFFWIEDGLASEPFIVSGIVALNSNPPWVIVDSTDRFHIFYQGKAMRSAGFSVDQIFHLEGSMQTGFGSPEKIHHKSGDYFGNIQCLEPRIDRDDVIYLMVVVTYLDLGSEIQDDFAKGAFLFHNNGFGFGNSELHLIGEAENHSESLYNDYAFDFSENNQIVLSYATLDTIGGLVSNRVSRQSANVEINTPPQLVIDYTDEVLIDLGFYNMTPKRIFADLPILISYENYYHSYKWFLSSDPAYPTFDENYCFFPIVLDTSEWYQHIPILEFDFSLLGPKGGEGAGYSFFAALLDPETAQVLYKPYSVSWFSYDTISQ